MAPGYYVGGYASGHPVMVPVIDLVEVGAGGGSIAWIDEIGALKVGPQSAAADPGRYAIAAGEPSRRSPMRISYWGGSIPTISGGQNGARREGSGQESCRRSPGRSR